MHGMLAVMKAVFATCPEINISMTVEENGEGRVGTALQRQICGITFAKS